MTEPALNAIRVVEAFDVVEECEAKLGSVRLDAVVFTLKLGR
jgi:hypothetical protein